MATTMRVDDPDSNPMRRRGTRLSGRRARQRRPIDRAYRACDGGMRSRARATCVADPAEEGRAARRLRGTDAGGRTGWPGLLPFHRRRRGQLQHSNAIGTLLRIHVRYIYGPRATARPPARQPPPSDLAPCGSFIPNQRLGAIRLEDGEPLLPFGQVSF